MTPVLHYSDAHAAFGTWHNVMVSIFTQQLQHEHLAEIKKVHEELLQRYPAGHMGVVLVEATAQAMRPELRAPTVDLMTQINKFSLAGCYVFSGGGVMMTSVRTVVSAMILASRPSRPNKAFSDLAAASQWIADQNAVSPQPRDVYTHEELAEGMRSLQRLHLARHSRLAATP